MGNEKMVPPSSPGSEKVPVDKGLEDIEEVTSIEFPTEMFGDEKKDETPRPPAPRDGGGFRKTE